MKCGGWLATFVATACVHAADPAAKPGRALYTDDFNHGLGQWVVEQRPGGSVTATESKMLIDDQDGCTVWFRLPLDAPVVISYEATMSSASRVSDLNCFWMASDPAHPDDLFPPGRTRDGLFAKYDSLRTYYVGYGGNANTTTRFRRYDGTGARPLLPEHDLHGAEFLLKAGHAYQITLVALSDGHVQFIRDGIVLFDVRDSAPLTRGWFGFRTVHSRIELRNFRVSPPESSTH